MEFSLWFFLLCVCLQLSLEPCQPSPCSAPACAEILAHALITSRPRCGSSSLAASLSLCCANSLECFLRQAASFLGLGSRSGCPPARGWSLVCSLCSSLCCYISLIPGSCCRHLFPSTSSLLSQPASASFWLRVSGFGLVFFTH